MMSAGEAKYTLEWKQRISEINKDMWDALALPLKTPIFEWDWLKQMEESGSIAPENGWLPFHLTVWKEEGKLAAGNADPRNAKQLVAAAPLYVKGHSAGEFVYDYVWADVADQLGIDYYPKLVGVCPATPMMGYRFLVDPREDEEWLTGRMVEAIDQFCLGNKISGCSFLFVDPGWHEKAESVSFLPWRHQSYVWENPGYVDFDDYLGSFNKNQRRNIRRERRKMAEQGIVIKTLTGEDIPAEYFDLMYDFYESTNQQFGPWAAKYLNREFFAGLYPDFCHRLLLVAAYRKGAYRKGAYGEGAGNPPVGMSLLLTKGDRLLGRYWGASEWIDSLHFNVCYYSPIEWAIKHGVKQFDPGAGSPHKIRRGFRAVPNFSLHRFYDQRMNQVMSVNIDRINRREQQHIDELNEGLPFRS